MALTLIDRLLGRTEPIEAKAALGPGAFSMTYGTPLHTLSRDPHRLMAEAEALFHTNAWIGAAERVLGGRFVRMGWHLEDENGDTVDEKSPEPYQVPLRLLERPNPDKTRGQLWGLSFRHLGLPGNAIWYLDQRDGQADTPLTIRYINPVRMSPQLDAGGNLLGWVLDDPQNQALNSMGAAPSRTGIPLERAEVLHFALDEPDWGHWGIGIPEGAQRKIELDRLTDAHGGGVLASGGRLTGLVSPKTGNTVTDDQWVQFVRDWRSITSDPDAAKRLQIAKMPLDFTQMTVSPKDLQLIEVSKQNRDDIFALWGVPVSMRGIPVPAGLNSDRSESDDAVIWETIKERSEGFREKVQYGLLDRWQALGVKVTLVLDYPEFDDRAPLYEAVEKSAYASITNDERRNILGLEPLEDEELGKAIYIASSLVRIDIEPEPEPVPPVLLPAIASEEEVEVIEKAALDKPLATLRAKVERLFEPRLRSAIAAVLTEQRRLVTTKAEHIARKPKETSWWNEAREQRRFMLALDPLISEMAAQVASETRSKVRPAKADPFIDDVLDAIRTSVGARIGGINATTREKVQAAVAAGVEAGESTADIGLRIRDSAAFDEYRSELISRTETAQVYNDAALHSYNAMEVTEVEAIDGDMDAECAARNGKRYPIDEAYGISDHPNGTLDWLPVVKAVLPPDPLLVMAEAYRASLERPHEPFSMPTPPPAIVNYSPPDIHVAAPHVTVDNSAIASAIAELKASFNQPARRRVIERDADGRIIGMVEE